MKLPSSSAHHTHKHTKLNKTPSTKLERYRKKGLSPRWATQCCSDATSWSERRPPSPTYQNQCAPGCQSPSQLRWRPSHSKLVKLGVTQIISQEGSVLTLEKASSTNQTSRKNKKENCKQFFQSAISPFLTPFCLHNDIFKYHNFETKISQLKFHEFLQLKFHLKFHLVCCRRTQKMDL